MQKQSKYRSIAAATTLALALAFTPLALRAQEAPNVATLTSTEAGVTVKVTPQAMGSANGRWEFKVVLDTHTGDLSDDMVNTAVLATADGREFKPKSWTGAGPGGHHREGILVFEASPSPAKVSELRIARTGEGAPRIFRLQP